MPRDTDTMNIPHADTSYQTFCDLVGGYRLFAVMREAVASGVVDRLDDGACSRDALLAATGLQPDAGARFISLLVSAGLLTEADGSLSLAPFSRAYLSRTSAVSQRAVLAFEPLLMENWQQLGTVLRQGQGALIREQPPEEYRQRLERYQEAMAAAARVRGPELWAALPPLPERGTIIDIGAGDGSYLRAFLARHPRWQGFGCDLADVCARAATSGLPDNLSFYPVNILAEQELADLVAAHCGSADLLLFSNLCHCYSPAENAALLQRTAPLLAEGGLLVIHDFFRDANPAGALYDLHMLVNTCSGRCYSVAETVALLQQAGCGDYRVVPLPSGSLAIVASRSPHSDGIMKPAGQVPAL